MATAESTWHATEPGDSAGTEVARLRREVGAEVDALARRVDRILGAAIVDLSERLGEEIVELRTRVALARDERRGGLRLEMRLRGLEERVSELVRDRAGLAADARRSRDAVVAALEDLAPELRSAVAPIEKAISLLEDGQHTIVERVGSAEKAVTDELRSVLARDEGRLGAMHTDLAERIDDLLSEGMVGLARIAERLETTAEAMPGELGRELSDGLVRLSEAAAQRLDEGVRSVETRVTRQVDDRVASTEARVVGRMDAIDERLEALAAVLREHDEHDLRLGEEGRRQLIADLAAALDGFICPTCGFVAKTAAGLSSHERTHA